MDSSERYVQFLMSEFTYLHPTSQYKYRTSFWNSRLWIPIRCARKIKQCWRVAFRSRNVSGCGNGNYFHCCHTKVKSFPYIMFLCLRPSTLGTLTSIETSKWKWLWQKLKDSPGSMKRGFNIVTTSKRSSCSTTPNC